MPKQSFSSAQKALLGSDFLNELGEDRRVVPLSKTVQAIVNEVESFVKDAANNLRTRTLGQGKLEESFEQIVEVAGDKIKIDVKALFYYKFIDQGVKGVKGGTGRYSFKTLTPSRSMVENLKGSLKFRQLSTSNVSKTFGIVTGKL